LCRRNNNPLIIVYRFGYFCFCCFNYIALISFYSITGNFSDLLGKIIESHTYLLIDSFNLFGSKASIVNHFLLSLLYSTKDNSLLNSKTIFGKLLTPNAGTGGGAHNLETTQVSRKRATLLVVPSGDLLLCRSLDVTRSGFYSLSATFMLPH